MERLLVEGRLRVLRTARLERSPIPSPPAQRLMYVSRVITCLLGLGFGSATMDLVNQGLSRRYLPSAPSLGAARQSG